MSTVDIPEQGGWQTRIVPRLPPRALSYASVVLVAAATVAVAAVATGGMPTTRAWIDLLLLAPLAAAAPLFSVSVGRNHAFHAAATFALAGALVLPPALLAALVVLLHVPQWIRERYPWYLQTFNISNYMVSVFAAWAVFRTISTGAPSEFAIGGVLGAVAFVVVNHVLLAPMLRLARGHSLRETDLFTRMSLGIDAVLASLGVAVAAFLVLNPWLLPTLLAPLVLANRSLTILPKVRESEERFRTMFASAPVGTMIIGLDCALLAANRAIEELLGCDEAALQALPETPIHPDDREEGAVLWKELVRGERDGYQRAVRYLRADGEIVYAHLAMALVRDADARPAFAIGMAVDVTGQTELEERLRQSQKLEAIGRLAGGVAHDFNNMLTAIGGYNALALERVDPDSPVRADLQEIGRATDRATALTRQLLAFSRKQVLQPELLNLNGVVVELEAMLRPLIGENVVLETDFEPALGPIEADPSQLQQVVLNLVVNARDAITEAAAGAEPPEGTLTVTTRRQHVTAADAPGLGLPRAGEYVCLSVQDDGVGMTEATRARIFDPFFTTKSVEQGAGLGLAATWGIVRQSGGAITVESQPGLGSTFTVYLPAVRERAEAGQHRRDQPVTGGDPAAQLAAAVADTGSDAAASELAAAEGSADLRTVLLVEDDHAVRRVTGRILRGAGYRVLEAGDGRSAFALWRGHTPDVDLLIADVQMPHLRGDTLARAVLAEHAELPVILMTGFGEPLTDAEASDEGPSDADAAGFAAGAYEAPPLVKPFAAADLLSRVGAALAGTGWRPPTTE